MLLHLLLIVLVILVTRKLIPWYLTFRAFRQKVDLIPGPNGWPILGNVPELIQKLKKGEMTRLLFKEYPEKYGPIFRFWTAFVPRIGLCSARHAEPLLSSTKLIKKSIDYDLTRDWLGDGLLLSSGLKWKTRRRLLTPAFHFTILENFIPIFVKCTERFVKVLEGKMVGQKFFDIYPLTSLASLDAICECAMGVEVEAQCSEESEYVKAVKRASVIANARSVQPWYYSDFVFYLSATGREQKKLLRMLHDFTRKIIEQRREEFRNKEVDDETTSRKPVFLDLLLSKDLELSDSDIQEEVDTFMFEGHDTTGAGIAWCLYELGRHPEIQEKAFEEIQSVLAKYDGKIDSRSLSEMKYLEACIKETQRIRPSVPVVVREATEDFQSGEYVVPKGAQVSVLIMSIHMDPEFYPDPEKYNPERFFSGEQVKRHPYSFIPFSAGPRNCIGQRFAMLETKTTIALFLNKFIVRSKEPISAIKPQAELILKPDIGLFIEVIQRD
ncbi:cytochrome P450 4C1-like [Artemia franciscana]|uniref:Cytochrome P450 n=2 Tax=Artemia franciscana TaxID=6661 RepID=A0AA88I8Q2_ARTSF|nr:hypothetical protein QYM36_002480 [Artemia franciscana]KAK2721924.1 hypothetical protein QYM36_002480 [Artemia franciscana]KAK2721926.1 hypothetical protein QYM36_002480 [Artemia franciscana]